MEPTTFHLRQGPETLTALGGLPLVGQAMARFSQLRQLIDPRFPVRGGIANSDILLAQLALLCQGKSDFEAIERYRRDPFFQQAMGLRAVPASPTLRQRLDEKEGIGWTYVGYVGYAPIAAYLGREGWNIGMELREGTQHSAEETDATLDRVLPRAMALTSSPLLVRMDAGFHGKAIAQTLARHDQERQAAGGAPIAFLIKWNRRGQNLTARIAQRLADPTAVWDCPRSGKRITIWEEVVQLGDVAVRRVLRLTERSSLANGQVLLLPETTLEGWDTTLPTEISSEAVIALYADHATHEQFHAEIKTDLDLERLQSGKFATNDLILTLGGIAYNLIANDWSGHPAGPRCSAAPSGQAPSRQDGDPGNHHPGGSSRPSCPPVDPLLPGFQAFQRLYAAWTAP